MQDMIKGSLEDSGGASAIDSCSHGVDQAGQRACCVLPPHPPPPGPHPGPHSPTTCWKNSSVPCCIIHAPTLFLKSTCDDWGVACAWPIAPWHRKETAGSNRPACVPCMELFATAASLAYLLMLVVFTGVAEVFIQGPISSTEMFEVMTTTRGSGGICRGWKACKRYS